MSLITLIKAHTHAGQLHAVGKEIEVLAHDAAWLIERGIAKLRGAPSKAASDLPEAKAATPADIPS